MFLFWRTIRRTSVLCNHLILSHNALCPRPLLPVYCDRLHRWNFTVYAAVPPPRARWVTESGTVSRAGPVSGVCSALCSFILAVYVEGREIPPPLPHHWPSPAEPRNSIQKLRYWKPPRFTTVRTWLLERIKSSDVTRLCRINIGSQKNR